MRRFVSIAVIAFSLAFAAGLDGELVRGFVRFLPKI
jgi:hypothetical protein